MSVLGLITEYNPFHNGHKYHLEESKQITNSKYSVCVMSGNFVQRGEPALVNKWARAKMAISAGIDLVIELPVVYSLQTAELFAYGGVKILDSLGIVDCISFGSENGNIEILDRISSIILEEPKEYKLGLKRYLDSGIPFPKAREKALNDVLKDTSSNAVGSSNNILGIEYLKAIKKINSRIKPYTIKRVNNNYNSPTIENNISSATSIRNALFDDINLGSLQNVVPKTTFDILNEEFSFNRGPVFSKDFENTIISEIRKMSIEDIKNIFDVSEGLENRIKSLSMKTSSIDELISLIKTKRYTQTRIQRILFHILLGIKKDFYKEIENFGGPQYIRVLGFNENGKKLLNMAKKKASLPIITKVANFKNTGNETFQRMLQCDITATDLYTLAYKNQKQKVGNLDLTHEIMIE